MKTIQDIVNTKVASMIESGAIEQAIEEGVEKAIKNAIDNQFKSYGNITKQIDTAIKEGLKVNTSELPFEAYNEQMLVIVKSKLGEMFKGQAAERFLEEMDRILAPAPKEMPVKDFIETIVGFWKSDEPWCDDDLDDEATVEIHPWGYGKGPDDCSIKMWKQASGGYSLSKNAPDLEIFILKGKIRINHHQTFNPTHFSEEEAFIFKLYAAGTVLTGFEGFDPTDCDLTLEDSEY